ncbi:unnamed protein product [Gongylonema pulchrum]|uniref:Uncharacterized protein n=1 Tax=Gongylonema pulchrum TaxID=637853 RepID=A0A3P6SH22_9BILA|nr:unnamed protein product [Gongylonema pulchrum]
MPSDRFKKAIGHWTAVVSTLRVKNANSSKCQWHFEVRTGEVMAEQVRTRRN